MASNSTDQVQERFKYGFKMAKAGFDANTATDYELLFSSGWPSLQIADSQTVSFPGGGGVGHVTHKLGFIPLAMAWCIQNGKITHRHFPQVSKDTIYFTDIDISSASYVLELYNIDITKQAVYAYIAPPPVNIGKYDDNYGVKFAKQAKKINSKDLNDFIFHSRAQSPAVLAVITTFDKTPAVLNSNTITYTTPKNYIPWAFGYASEDGLIYTYAQPYAQAVPRLFVNLVKPGSFTLSATDTSKGGSLIMLRDPLFVAKEIQTVYG